MRKIVTRLALGLGILGLCAMPAAMAEDAAPAAGQAAPAAAPVDATVDADLLAALKKEGANVYFAKCQSCHAQGGAGGAGPALIGGSPAVENTEEMLRQVIFGGSYMPPFGSLTDRDIAAVTTYIRTSWGNDYGPVTEEAVAAAR